MKNNEIIGHKPTPLRLGSLTPLLRSAASEMEWSSQHLIRNILEEWLIKKYGYQKDHFKKLRQQKKTA